MENLYVHFPFCRRRCGYCTLYSRVGVGESERAAYVRRLADGIAGGECGKEGQTSSVKFKTVYFGGGSPGLCDLKPLFEALRPRLTADVEFTVELHPQDVTDERLAQLKAGGVNRISLGVQSLDDRVLKSMGRGSSAAEAEQAFRKVRHVFDNAGIDLIVGLPHDEDFVERLPRLRDWGLRHCSVYALQNERNLSPVPDDDVLMDRLSATADFLKSIGLERYEISNYAVTGFECRHNFAVWRGEDYLGLGDGAYGRQGLVRTKSLGGAHPESETVSADLDDRERRFFRLRTREGLETTGHDAWLPVLDRFVGDGLLTRKGNVYFLTLRGTEVCDSILAEL